MEYCTCMPQPDSLFVKSIQIKNVRGISNLKIDINLTRNKPTLLIAPNGSGKTSFAVAFESLQENRINLPDSEYHKGDANNQPEIEIVLGDNRILKATHKSNDISSEIASCVLRNKVKAKSHNIPLYGISKANLAIDPIILIKNIPEKVTLEIDDIFQSILEKYNRLRHNYTIKKILENAIYLSNVSFDDLSTLGKKWEAIQEILNTSTESAENLADYFSNLKAKLLNFETKAISLKRLANTLSDLCGVEHENSLILILQLYNTYNKDRLKFKKYINYQTYHQKKKHYNKIYEIFHKTWKNIKPKEKNKNLIIEFPSPQSISNGERDILQIFSQLIYFDELKSKKNCILIIDELFDYLDDGNFISAQYYISKYIKEAKKEGKNIFPIILSHLHPGFYRNYAFSKINIVYFKHFPNARITDKTKKLIRVRTSDENSPNSIFISKYLFHYDPDLNKKIPDGLSELQWKKVHNFALYSKKQLDNYLYSNTEKYDPVIISVELRRLIEKYCYDNLQEEADRRTFLETHKTASKIEYASSKGVNIEEVFSLLGIVYNEALHCNDKALPIFENTLMSRLFNATIRSMIEEVHKICTM